MKLERRRWLSSFTPRPSRRSLLCAVTLVAIVLALGLVFLRRRDGARAIVPSSASTNSPVVDVEPDRLVAAPPQGTPLTMKPRARAPVVDALDVERPVVCAGEETLVTIRAHGAEGDGDLTFDIDGQRGASVPVRPMLDDEGRTRPVYARAQASDGTVTKVAVPVTARACPPPAHAEISSRPLANTNDGVELGVTLVDDGPLGRAPRVPPARARSYQWTFGDGATGATRDPTAEHTYDGRAQKSAYSEFVVAVEVKLEDGRTLRGRRALTFYNRAFELLRTKGVALLAASLTPRFPVATEDGSVTQTVRLTAVAEPVTLRGAVRRRTFRDGHQSDPEAVPVAALAGSTTLAARGALVFPVTLDAREPADVSLVTYDLFGTTQSGIPARGSFSILRPPPLPTRASSDPVDDPVLASKIRRAQKVLGRSFVTDDDLRRLERAGSFEDSHASR